MAWKDPKQKEKYLEYRADPEFVAKKKKYLNAWYKKNRKKQLVYKKKRLRGPEGDAIRARRQVWKKKYFAGLRKRGLSRRYKPLLTPEERYMFEIFSGLQSAYEVPKTKRVAYAKHGARVATKNRRIKMVAIAKKFKKEIEIVKRMIKH